MSDSISVNVHPDDDTVTRAVLDDTYKSVEVNLNGLSGYSCVYLFYRKDAIRNVRELRDAAQALLDSLEQDAQS